MGSRCARVVIQAHSRTAWMVRLRECGTSRGIPLRSSWSVVPGQANRRQSSATELNCAQKFYLLDSQRAGGAAWFVSVLGCSRKDLVNKEQKSKGKGKEVGGWSAPRLPASRMRVLVTLPFYVLYFFFFSRLVAVFSSGRFALRAPEAALTSRFQKIMRNTWT